jgi:hypothetical protein
LPAPAPTSAIPSMSDLMGFFIVVLFLMVCAAAKKLADE